MSDNNELNPFSDEHVIRVSPRVPVGAWTKITMHYTNGPGGEEAIVHHIVPKEGIHSSLLMHSEEFHVESACDCDPTYKIASDTSYTTYIIQHNKSATPGKPKYTPKLTLVK